MSKAIAIALGVAAAVLVLALAVALLLRAFVFQTYYTASDGMSPTFREGDRVVVSKRATVQRGDVIILDVPDTRSPGQRIEVMKRAVAVGGDTVNFRDGELIVNGAAVPERYLLQSGVTYAGPTGEDPGTVPDHQVYVLGDNRENSEDSRAYGPVDIDQVVGVVERTLPDHL